MSGSLHGGEKHAALRNRSKPIKKWLRTEEIALINYIKENRDFEKPISRVYYNKFLDKTGIDASWKHVRSKVRNMRTTYRKAKEFEINKRYYNNLDASTVRNEMSKICWYLDDFDELFPNEMDYHINTNPHDPDIDDEFSNQEFPNVNDSIKSINESVIDDELSSSSASKSNDGDIFTARKNIFNLKRKKHYKDTSLKQQELDLARERFNFEKEKFHKEFKLKEKEIESQERLKIMELQMNERIAMKGLEIKEKLALQTNKKDENTSNNVHHNST